MKIFKVVAKRYWLQQKKTEYIGIEKFKKFWEGTIEYWKDYYDVYVYEMSENWKYILLKEYPYQYCNCDKRNNIFSFSLLNMKRCPHCRQLYPVKNK